MQWTTTNWSSEKKRPGVNLLLSYFRDNYLSLQLTSSDFRIKAETF